MKKWIAILLVLLLGLAACAEPAEEADYGYEFDDEGYSGEWLPLEGLYLQFCLPEGWTVVETEPDAALNAVSGDGAVALDIRVEAKEVDSVDAWAVENLDDFETAEAGFYMAAIEETDAALILRVVDYDGQLIAFRFTRETPEAIDVPTALQIVGSLTEDWDAMFNSDDGTDIEEDIFGLEDEAVADD